MFQKKSVLVVGAGASKEVNLPTGRELKQRIASHLDIRFERSGIRKIGGDDIIYEAIRHIVSRNNPKSNDTSEYLRSSWRIRDAMPQAISIDNFIDAHQGDRKLELCGKLAIARSILEAERNSLLYFDISRGGRSAPNYQSFENTWFNSFMQLLSENCRADSLEERLSSISIIVFNYDRCIEHFLYHSLQTYYGITSDRAAALVRGIKIYHPYGTVGELPWYGGARTIEYGGEPSPKQLIELASQIKTFAEGTDPDSSDVAAIRKAMANSHIVLFLGFAFHRLNLELIRPFHDAHASTRDIRYFATGKGVSKSDCEAIRSDLVNMMRAGHENVLLKDLTCSQLFKEYWRSLRLS